MKETYRLLGVDPGTNVLGYAIIEIRGKEACLLDMGAIKMQHLASQQDKLRHIFEHLQEIIRSFEPRQMAIEAPFFGKNVQSMLKLGRAQGVAIAAAITLNVEVTEYSPRKIKQSVTGNGNAAKEQVAAMLAQILRVNLDAQLLDATDALATAMCHFFQGNLPNTGSRYDDWSAFLKENPDRKR